MIHCDGSIIGCAIRENSASNSGGGLYDCNGSISTCTIIGNSADSWGGGMLYGDGPLVSCIIAGNSAGYAGGLVWHGGSITNCSIIGNSAAYNGGGLRGCAGAITNCIIWANNAPMDPQLRECSAPTYSCIQDWPSGGQGNTSEDPAFVDPDGLDDDPATWQDNDYHLRDYSPCVNAGDPSGDYTGQVDMDGDPRVLYARVDMGADEVTPIAGDCEPDGDVDMDDFSVFEAAINGPAQTTDDPAADFDGDGDCDLDDFASFAANFTGPL